ncbi:MAG: 3-phosphoshikimate 1-carboxyvinyltransferase [Chlamydiales bacterium 38-26]|nr:3-phosphoshikimate 1-carboxyvinyltransferase [Chlamydiales bacterium]OJV07661.1 MAG: 3-phosphoshikimate 1-carboxyvinyltransferase [Chlamydiales bacterium 38-26]
MKKLHVKPSQMGQEIKIPPSKSQTHRAILLAALAKGKSKIFNPLKSSDTLAMIQACRHFGAEIHIHPEHLEIQGVGGKIAYSEDVIQAHNSGIVLRFITALAALCQRPVVITGDYSIRHLRPMQILMDALTQLGVKAESTRGDGYAPLIVRGPLRPGSCYIEDGSDSQNVSALLLAAIFMEGTLELYVSQPGEKPWVEMTLDWLKKLNVPYQHHNYEKYQVHGIQEYEGFEYTVPGDWSSAAFPLAAALITQSEVVLRNLDPHDIQGDKKILEILRAMGAEIKTTDQSVHVLKGVRLKGRKIDVNDCIDAVPILATLACFAQGETQLLNAAVARQKECDRLACTALELKKMGGHIVEIDEGLIIHGAPLQGASVFSHGDHRLAMALVVAGLAAQDETYVEDISCIEKTYPSFCEDFKRMGAQLEEIS